MPKRTRTRSRAKSAKRNPPELRKVHAGLESAYLAAIARKDPASRALAKRIKGPWVAVEKMLKKPKRARSGSARRTRANPAKRSRGRELLAFTVKRGGKAVGTVLAATAAAAGREAKSAGLQLGRELKGEFCRNPPPGHTAVLSRRAFALAYRHSDDDQAYEHKFGKGVTVRVSRDRKRVTLERPDGKVLAAQYRVD